MKRIRFFLFLSLVLDTKSLDLALVHDESFNLVNPRENAEKWIASVVDDVAAQNRCPPLTPVQVQAILVPTEVILSKNIQFLLGKFARFDGFVVLSHCQAADLLSAYIQSVADVPVMQVDFVDCNTFNWSNKVSNLQLFRLGHSKRYRCAHYALNQWVFHTLCMPSVDRKTQTLLNSSFNVSKTLQECANVDEKEWLQKIYATHIHIPDNVIRYYLNGRMLRLTSLERPPFVTFYENIENGSQVVAHKGFCYEVIHALQKVYNFTYQVILPEDNSYGTPMDNGDWSGMIGMIINSAADVGVAPFSVTSSRQKVVGFTVAYYEETTAILIQPPVKDTPLLVCAKPFRLEVWIFLFSSMILLPAVLLFHFRILNHQHKKKTRHPGNAQIKIPGMGQLCVYTFAILVGQSGQKMLGIGNSPRFLSAIWCMSAVVFIHVYIGILMSIMSFPKLKPVIHSLDELPASKLQWGVRRGTALESLFLKASDGLYKAIGDGLLKKPDMLLVETDAEGIQNVINGSFAYIKEKSFLETAIENDYVRSGKCRLSVAKQEFFKVNFAFVLRSSSPLQGIFDNKILQMAQGGLMEYWRKFNWPANKGCTHSSHYQKMSQKLTMADLQSAFFILVFGISLSFLTFLGETLVSRIVNSRFFVSV